MKIPNCLTLFRIALNGVTINLLKEKIPVGKLGEPIDVANLALFLAKSSASYLTGQVFEVGGGFSG